MEIEKSPIGRLELRGYTIMICTTTVSSGLRWQTVISDIRNLDVVKLALDWTRNKNEQDTAYSQAQKA